MGFQLLELPVNISSAPYGVAGFVVAIIVIAKLSQGPNVSISCGRNSCSSLNLYEFHQLNAIPAVGSSNWLGAWWAGFKYLTNAQNIIQQGYEKVCPMRRMVIV